MKIVIDIDADVFAKLTEYGEPLPAGNSFYDSILTAVAKGNPYAEHTGYWIEEPSKLPHCSVCGTYSDDADREDGGFYCTHCGSRMIEVQDEDQ